jgi:hypothetical protein
MKVNSRSNIMGFFSNLALCNVNDPPTNMTAIDRIEVLGHSIFAQIYLHFLILYVFIMYFTTFDLSIRKVFLVKKFMKRKAYL